jgi:hypothetical protein
VWLSFYLFLYIYLYMSAFTSLTIPPSMVSTDPRGSFSSFDDEFEELTLSSDREEETLLGLLKQLTKKNLWSVMRMTPAEHAYAFAVSGSEPDQIGWYTKAIQYMVDNVGVDPDILPTDWNGRNIDYDSTVNETLTRSGQPEIHKRLSKWGKSIQGIRAIGRFNAGNTASPGTMAVAAASGRFTKAGGKMPFPNYSACMDASYINNMGTVQKYSKDYLYFMAGGMGLHVNRKMKKEELCRLIVHGQRSAQSPF